jgi:hypothetical protein
MTLAELLDFEKLLGGTIDFKEKTIEIKVLGFSIKGIKFPWIKALKDNSGRMEDVVVELFLKKKILWFDLRRETVELCILSLEDLVTMCNEWIKEYCYLVRSLLLFIIFKYYPTDRIIPLTAKN